MNTPNPIFTDEVAKKSMEALGLSTDPAKQPPPSSAASAITDGLVVMRVESRYEFLRYQIVKMEIRDTSEAYYVGSPGKFAGYRKGPKQPVRRLIGFGSTEQRALDMAREFLIRQVRTITTKQKAA